MRVHPGLLLASVVGVVLSGCGNSSGGGNGVSSKPLKIESERFIVPALQETTLCYTVYAENAHMDFRRITSSMVAGSHHLILWRDASDLLPNGQPPPAGLGECLMETTHPRLYVYSSQEAEHDVSLPEGVVGELKENTIFILELHFANASNESIEAFADVTIYPTEKQEGDEYNGILFFMNTDFAIPPGAGMDGSEAHTDGTVCEVPEDLNVFRMQSHTHKRGIKVEGWHSKPGTATPQKIYKNEDWHAPVSRVFEEPALAMTAGDQIAFECTWTNETDDRVIEYGPSVEDEMCILGLAYYPRLLGMLDGNVFCFNGNVYY